MVAFPKVAAAFALLLAASLVTAQGPARSGPAPAGASQQQLSPDQLRTLMRDLLGNLQNSDDRLNDYAYLRHNVRREFNSEGKQTEEHTFVARRDFLEGDSGQDFGWIRQIERDGQPVPAEEIAASEASARARIAEIEAMSPAERAQLEEERRKERDEANSWLKEFPEALDYREIGQETVNGRATRVVAVSPRPGYHASNMRARVFEKVRGRVWIDVQEKQLVKVDAQVFDTVNIGWGVLGRIHEGTRFQLERRKIDDGSWLPASQSIRFAARVLMFKNIAQEEITRYSDFEHKSEQLAQASPVALVE